MDAEPGSTAAPHAPAQALFPVSGGALFPFPSAMLALPAGTEVRELCVVSALAPEDLELSASHASVGAGSGIGLDEDEQLLRGSARRSCALRGSAKRANRAAWLAQLLLGQRGCSSRSCV
jgi:hypothetical protein